MWNCLIPSLISQNQNNKWYWSNFKSCDLIVIADSNYETNFPHTLLLTNRQVLRLLKAFVVYQLIQNYRKLDCLGWYSQEDLF